MRSMSILVPSLFVVFAVVPVPVLAVPATLTRRGDDYPPPAAMIDRLEASVDVAPHSPF